MQSQETEGVSSLPTRPIRQVLTPAPAPGTTPGATARAQWRALLFAIAAGLSIGGFSLLSAENLRLWGCAMLVVAGAVGVSAFGYLRPYSAFGNPTSVHDQVTSKSGDGPRRNLALAGIVLGVVAEIAADLQFLANQTDTFGLAGALWLLGLALLISGAATWPRVSPSAGFVSPGPLPLAWSSLETTILLGLLALALILRLWNLAEIPNNIYPDEIMTGVVARQAYMGGPNPPVFTTLWGGIDLPALWFFLIAGSLKIGGTTLGMLRLPAALFGAATVLPFYGLVRQIWGRTAAIAGSAILAFSASDVNYSRVTLNNILPQFFWAACFYFLLRGIRMRRPLDWVLAGAAGGLSEYGYYGTRLLPFVLLAFFAYLLIVHWRQSRKMLAYFGLVALGYLVAFGPLFAYYFSRPSAYFGRPTGTQILSRVLGSFPDPGAMLSAIWPSLSETLLGINTHPSQDLAYFAPLLLVGEAALLVLGTALLIWQWRHPGAFLLLLSGWGAILGGGVLVLYSAPPFLDHLTPGFPAIYAAIAIPFQGISQTVRGSLFLRLPTAVTLPRLRISYSTLITALVLATLGTLDLNFYFGQYYADPGVLNTRLVRVQMQYETQTALSRWQATLGPRYQPYIVGRTSQQYDPETTSFLVSAPPAIHIWDPTTDLPASAPPGLGMVFVFFPDAIQLRDIIAHHFPGGADEEKDSRDGRLLFNAYVLAPP